MISPAPEPIVSIGVRLRARRIVEVVAAAYRGNRLNLQRSLQRHFVLERGRNSSGASTMTLIIIIVVLVLLFGGGGGYYAHRTWGGPGLGGVIGLIVIVLLVLWLLGRL
jgi:hypothetical protein